MVWKASENVVVAEFITADAIRLACSAVTELEGKVISVETTTLPAATEVTLM